MPAGTLAKRGIRSGLIEKNKFMKSYYFWSVFWSVVGKVVNSAIAFIATPIILDLYGKNDYGIITLVMSINAFLHMMDLGMNTGSIKFFAQWRKERDFTLLDQVSRTNITFYLCVATINVLVYTVIIFFGRHFVNITDADFALLKCFLATMIVPIYFVWIGAVYQQHLIAAEKIYIIQIAEIPKAAFQLLALGIAYLLNASIKTYFALYALSYCVPFLIYLVSCYKLSITRLIVPGFFFKQFKIVFTYSIYVFVLSFIQLFATHSRPIILGIFCKNSTSEIAEYRFIEVFMLFVLSLGSILVPMFLPKASQYLSEKNAAAVREMAYKGTRYSCIIMTLVCGAICYSAADLLTIYVGKEYIYLSKWMIFWTLILLATLPNAPITSLTLASGNLKPLIISSATGCVISILINIMLCNVIGLGSAIVGYSVYILIQLATYYIYYVPNILRINSFVIFKSVSVPILLGGATLIPLFLIRMDPGWQALFRRMLILVVWGGVYLCILTLAKQISIDEARQILKK